MLTRVWQAIKNDGTERPHQPTVFEYYRKESGAPINETWVVVQHMNLRSTNYSDYPGYGQPYGANLDSPGFHSGGGDLATWNILQNVMDNDHPSLVMVDFGMTDGTAHSGNWSAYTNSIRVADTLIYSLWSKIQNATEYRDKTTIFITNDHGRHLDGVKTGFKAHGDNCEGCRHVMMLAIGPDIRVNAVTNATRELIDIAPPIGAFMGFSTPLANGTLMSEMLIAQLAANADINKDGIVNILDVTIVAMAFGSKLGVEKWNGTADVDMNGIIHIIDVSIVAKNYGKVVA
jgi:hypothetical protein